MQHSKLIKIIHIELLLFLFFLSCTNSTASDQLVWLSEDQLNETQLSAKQSLQNFTDELIKYHNKYKRWPVGATKEIAFGVIVDENESLKKRIGFGIGTGNEDFFSSYNTRGEIEYKKNKDGKTIVKGCLYQYLNKENLEKKDSYILAIQKAKSGIIIIAFSNGEVKVSKILSDDKEKIIPGMTLKEANNTFRN